MIYQTQKSEYRTIRTPQKQRMNPCAVARKVVPAPLMAPVVLLQLKSGYKSWMRK